MKVIFGKVFIALSLISLLGCRNEIDDYDKAPDWLKGNAYQLLKSKQNFELFLQAAELVGYEPLLNGAGLCTVFAPTDSAFNNWLGANAYSSVEDAYQREPDRLRILIGYHLVEQAFSTSMLLGFQMNNKPGVVATDEGTCFKYKTYSKENPVEMFDPVSHKNVMVYQREKYLPIISTRLYKTKECADYKAMHEYFFPDVNWKGDNDRLYVANASMIEVGLPTDNGYVYTLDKVVDPLRTLSKALQDPKNDEINFSAYYGLMDRFANFVYDKTISEKFALPGEKYYLLYHNAAPRSRDKGVDLPELASEWSYHGQEDAARPSYNRYLSDNYNCFAFTNEAFAEFTRKYFPEFIDNYNQIPDITVYYLLLAHAYDHQQIMLPNQIDAKGVNGQMGENWKITTENIKYREFCANGILYGIDSVFRPTVFDIITKPLFTSSRYSIVANMFRISNEFVTIVDREKDHYTLFIQSDETLESKYDMRVNYKNPEFGDETVEYRNGSGNMADYESAKHVQSHIIYGAVRPEPVGKFYAAKYPFSYVYVSNDTVYSEDRVGHKIINTEGIETENGITYEIDGKFGQNTSELSVVLQQTDFVTFFGKLQDSKLVYTEDGKLNWSFLTSGERFMVFVPDDAALANAPTDSLQLVDYLRKCFVPVTTNQLSNYVLPGFGTSQTVTLNSFAIDRKNSTSVKTVYVPIQINNSDPKVLRLISNGETIETNPEMPRFTTNGVIFKMTSGFTVPENK